MDTSKSSSSSGRGVPNPARRMEIIWWLLCALGILGIFAPHLLGVDAMQWGFGISFFALILAITAIFLAIIYHKRARLLSTMLSKENLLAHWVYTPEEWKKYTGKEYEEDKLEKKNLFLLIVGVCIAVGIVLVIIEPQGWLIFLYTIIGIIVLMGIVALFAVWRRHRQNLKYLGETYISADAVYLNRELHVWRGFGASLEEVNYEDTYRNQPIMKIVYSTPNRYNRQYVSIRVPVPKGEEETARKIVNQLQAVQAYPVESS